MDKRQLERQIERIKKNIEIYKVREKSLSAHGYWSLGYYQGKLTAMEDSLDDLEEAELVATQETAEKIFAEIKVRPLGNTDLYVIDREEFDALREKYYLSRGIK